MTTYDAVTAISTLLSLAGLWVLVFWLYRDYRIDSFRQEMFALRDECFDAAAGGHVPFSQPAYGLLRTTMNGFIRFGHRFTLSQALIIVVVAREEIDREPEESFSARWRKAIQDLSTDQLSTLENYRRRMNLVVLKHVILSSPVLVGTLVAPLLAWLVAQFCLSRALGWLREPLDGIDSVALSEGMA